MQTCPRRSAGRMAFEVVGGSDDNGTKVRADLDRDHVLLDRFAKSNTGIEATLDYIDQPVIDVNFDVDVWVREQKRRKLGL